MNEQHELAQAISELRETDARKIIQRMENEGVPALDILHQCHAGMAEVGRRFEEGECFIPELIIAGKIMEKLMKDLEPLLKTSTAADKPSACVVMGTVHNDVHNIGKDIVVMMLRGSGFNVVDLGVNVTPETFVQAIQQHNPILVGMSVLLTTCYKSITETVEAIKKAGLRDRVAVMLGGAAATALCADKTGCDYYGATSVDAVRFANEVAGR